MNENLLIVIVIFVSRFLLGAWITARRSVISLANWCVYLSNLHSPKAIIRDSNGQLIFANKSCEGLFNIEVDHDFYSFKYEQDKETIFQ